MGYKDPAKQSAYQVEYARRRRLAWLAQNGPCVACGSTEELEVDHRDPDQKISHRIWSWSTARREVELKKCQVLCAACHKVKSASELMRPVPHGTNSSYTRRKCRCDSCTEAHRVTKQAWRDSRKERSLPYT